MRKNISVDQMSINEIAKLNKLLSLIFLCCWPFFYLIFTFHTNAIYTKIIMVIGCFIILSCILIIILSQKGLFVFLVNSIGVPFVSFLFVIALYLFSSENLQPSNTFSKVLIFLNIFIIELSLIFKRLIIKNDNFITALKNHSHTKYIFYDIIQAFTEGIIILFISKYYDDAFQSINIYSFVEFFFGYLVFIVGTTAHIYGIVNYYHIGRFKSIKKH